VAPSPAAPSRGAKPTDRPGIRPQHDASTVLDRQRDQAAEGSKLTRCCRFPSLRHPRHDCVKNGGGMWPQCGAKRSKSRICDVKRPRMGLRRNDCGAAKIAAILAIPRANFAARGVDNLRTRRLYRPSWRAAALRDGASAKPLTVCTVNAHPAMSKMVMSDVRVSAALPSMPGGRDQTTGSAMFDK
jgi:hypothetical protein